MTKFSKRSTTSTTTSASTQLYTSQLLTDTYGCIATYQQNFKGNVADTTQIGELMACVAKAAVSDHVTQTTGIPTNGFPAIPTIGNITSNLPFGL
jgi:hypothetical protein